MKQERDFGIENIKNWVRNIFGYKKKESTEVNSVVFVPDDGQIRKPLVEWVGGNVEKTRRNMKEMEKEEKKHTNVVVNNKPRGTV